MNLRTVNVYQGLIEHQAQADLREGKSNRVILDNFEIL